LEIEFEFQNRPYKFIDAESGEMLKLSPKEVKQEYVKQAQAFSQELKLRCGQHKIDFVEADINQGLDAVLLAYLLKRQKML
jgi:hypothetical protein